MQRYTFCLAVVLIVIAALFTLSCGKSSSTPRSVVLSAESLSTNTTKDAGFWVEPIEDEYDEGGGQGRLSARVMGENERGNLLVSVDVTSARGLKSALLHLHYDSSRYTPVEVRQGGFFPDAVFLGVTALPGIVPIGAVITNPDESDGVDGEGVLSTVEFAVAPFAGERRVSAVPMNDANRILYASVKDDSGLKTVTISFTERNAGDYNLDTDVTIADVGPIARYYLEIVGSGDPASDPVAVVDGNSSGDITIADVAPIASNYLNVVQAYGVTWGIEGVKIGELPNLDDDALPYSLSRIYEGDELKPQYEYTFDYGANPLYNGDNADALSFWLRPYANGEFGIESGPFDTASTPVDTDPPSWLSGFGIIFAAYNELSTAVEITFGQAADTMSPPVKYVAYWQVGDTIDFADATANGRFVELDIAGQTESPYEAILTAADGVAIGETLSLAVHARDGANPHNETAPYENPVIRDGKDWITVEPGVPPEDTPPVWLSTIGITETSPGNTSVTVGWGYAIHLDGDVSYNVYWAEGNLSTNPLAFFSIAQHDNVLDAVQHTIEGLTNGQTYSFAVRAVSPKGLEDSNNKILAETPQESIFPFQLPAEDGVYNCGVNSTDSDIVLTPIDNAPVIVYTKGSQNRLAVTYYDGADWVHEVVSDTGRFDHPSIEIIGEEIVVSAYNRNSKAIELYTGDINAQNWVLETVDTKSLGEGDLKYCLTASMDYEPDSEVLGIVYNAGVNSTKSILKYAFRVASGEWTIEIIQDGAGSEDAPGASLMFTPNGTPSVAYTYGDYDWGSAYYNTYVHYGTREAESWEASQIPGSWQAVLPIFLAYNTITDKPFIIFGRDRAVDVGEGQSVDITDTVVAWKDVEGIWQDQVLEQGDAVWDGGLTITVDFSGQDPVIGFNKAGQGFLYYSFVHAEVTPDDLDARSYLTGSTFDGLGWDFPVRLDENPLNGCSAINMAIDVAEARLTYQRIGILDTNPGENAFPSGTLIYHQF